MQKIILPVKYILLPSLQGRGRVEGPHLTSLPARKGQGGGFSFSHFIFLFSFFLSSLLISSCGEAERLYDTFPAYFVVQNTNTVPQLNTAMNGMGEFCTITDNGSQYVFTDLGGSTPVNKTALGIYRNFRMGRSGGFITGLPTYIADASPRVVCYDIVCPNCYEQTSIAPHLRLATGCRAQCGSCHRTYDLNNLGMMIAGEPGRSLYRYNVSYAPYTLVISN